MSRGYRRHSGSLWEADRAGQRQLCFAKVWEGMYYLLGACRLSRRFLSFAHLDICFGEEKSSKVRGLWSTKRR